MTIKLRSSSSSGVGSSGPIAYKGGRDRSSHRVCCSNSRSIRSSRRECLGDSTACSTSSSGSRVVVLIIDKAWVILVVGVRGANLVGQGEGCGGWAAWGIKAAASTGFDR